MARSRRKTPICGITIADTDKPFKTTEHRRERRAVNVALATGEEPPAPKQYGNPWASHKDGKQRFDPRRHPSLMRK
jgi:hypothetical protein